MDAHRAPSTLERIAAVTAPSAGGRVLDDAERERARAELHAHYRERFGRLDLRGLVLATDPGVHAPSVDVDEVYQPLEAVEIDGTGAPAPAWHPISMAAGTSAFELDDDSSSAVVRLLVPPAPLETLLARPRRRPALLLGGPGAGKTMFLRRCAVRASSDQPFLGLERAVPVYLPLATVRNAPARPLPDHAIDALRADGLAIADALAAEAEAGRVLFLLDGLDEVGEAIQAVADAVTALARAYPAARVLVTSRPVGLHGVELAVDHLQLEGLDDEAIAKLLVRWCELDERRRGGDDAAELGLADGRRLARQVLTTPTAHDLAGTPFEATLLALTHRGALALPGRRIELYHRLLELLVARWNQARRAGEDGPTPLSVGEALRLLAPVGLAMVERGRGALELTALRAIVTDAIEAAALPMVDDVDGTIACWRDELGLLVERAPGVVGLVHESLAELLAAHALVATGGLEELIRDPARCFAPAWFEVIRFGLGIVGSLADDVLRLGLTVRALVAEANAARARPSPLVPELLGSVLVDDPGLTPPLAAAICDELVPAWWFDGTPAFDGEHAGTALAQRIIDGPWARPLAIALNQRYRDGWGNQLEGGLRGRIGPLGLLRRLGASQPLMLCEALVAAMASGASAPAGPERFMPLLQIPLPANEAAAHLRFSMRVSGLSVLLNEGAGRLFFAAMPGDPHGDRSWIELEDASGTRLIGRRLDAPPPETAELIGTIHIAVAEHPDPALLPAVLSAWQELASRAPDAGPRPPATVDEAMARYGAIDVN
jgi:hypothetical protein